MDSLLKDKFDRVMTDARKAFSGGIEPRARMFPIGLDMDTEKPCGCAFGAAFVGAELQPSSLLDVANPWTSSILDHYRLTIVQFNDFAIGFDDGIDPPKDYEPAEYDAEAAVYQLGYAFGIECRKAVPNG